MSHCFTLHDTLHMLVIYTVVFLILLFVVVLFTHKVVNITRFVKSKNVADRVTKKSSLDPSKIIDADSISLWSDK